MTAKCPECGAIMGREVIVKCAFCGAITIIIDDDKEAEID